MSPVQPNWYKRHECPNGGGSNETVFAAYEGQQQGWLLDSGESSYMTPIKEDFVKYTVLKNLVEVNIADGAGMKAIGCGRVRF